MVTTRFSLAPVSDRKFGVPSRSHVLFDNRRTGLVLEGTILERQYETYSGFLLLVTYDDQLDGLYAKPLQIYLLSPAITVLDVRSIVGGFFGDVQLESLFVTGDDVFQFTFSDRWRLTVLKQPRFHVIRRAYDWGQQGPAGAHHTDYFAYRYLNLERVR